MTNNPMDYFRQLEQMGEQIRNMFGHQDFIKNFVPNMPDMFGQIPHGTTGSSPVGGLDFMKGQYPRMDLYQTQHELIAIVEVPGLEGSTDVSVSVEPHRLYIKGLQSGAYFNVPKENLIISERHRGSFEREVTLPVRVLPKEVKAYYKHGVLEIRMVKDGRSGEQGYGHKVPISF